MECVIIKPCAFGVLQNGHGITESKIETPFCSPPFNFRKPQKDPKTVTNTMYTAEPVCSKPIGTNSGLKGDLLEDGE